MATANRIGRTQGGGSDEEKIYLFPRPDQFGLSLDNVLSDDDAAHAVADEDKPIARQHAIDPHVLLEVIHNVA
jgi:hypothetical protein